MKKISIPFFTFLMIAFALSSCRQDEASPIRNIKAGPTLLRAQAGSGSCTSYTYFYENEEKSLGNIFTKQLLVGFVGGLTAEQETEIVNSYGFVQGKSGQLSTNSALLHNIELADGLNCKQVELAMELLMKDPNIAYVAPYFLNGDGLLGISNEAIVTIAEGRADVLETLAAKYNAEVLMPLSGQTYLLRVDKNSDGNALELANYLKGQEGVVHAEPDFIISGEVPATASDRRGMRAGYTR
ncbi:MAG: hypothetical protein LPK03_08345 [Pontibacter sp.]|nr:hypothetical protein [Pontibacter sp.]